MPIFVLEAACNRLRAFVTLNDIEVFAETQGRAKTTQMKVNQFVVAGENKISVTLQPVLNALESADLSRTGECSVRFFQGEQGRLPTDDDVLARFVWDSVATPLRVDEPTIVWTSSIRLDGITPRWAWQNALATGLTDSDRREMTQIIARVRQALAARDIESVNAALSLKTREYATALDVPDEELIKDQTAYLQQLISPADWIVHPLDEQALIFDPMAGGRLVSVKLANGAPPIRGTSSAGTYVILPVFTRVDKRWVIAR